MSLGSAAMKGKLDREPIVEQLEQSMNGQLIIES
jgi:hypothetical protein